MCCKRIEHTKVLCAEELSTRSIHESESMNLISKASVWKRDREIFSTNVIIRFICSVPSLLNIFVDEMTWIRNKDNSGDMCFLNCECLPN